jgi:hypothetical protein
MKKIIISLLLLITSSAQAGADLGKTLSIATAPNSGDYQLGVQFAYDAGLTGDKFNLIWSILFGTTISNQELSSLPAQLKWNVFDGKTQKYLDVWANRPVVGKDTLKLGTVAVDGEIAKLVIGNQSSVYLVFSDLSGTPIYNLNVGDLCKAQSSYFVNLTDTAKRCYQVTVTEIETAQKLFCDDESKQLQQYLKEGLITCNVAKSVYVKKGCGEFSCK